MPTEPLLQRRRIATIADLLCKVEANDWHGVADAAMDLREIDAVLKNRRDQVSTLPRPALSKNPLSTPTAMPITIPTFGD